VADHQLLARIAHQQAGKMIYPADMSNLPKLIESRDDIKPVTYLQNELKDILNFKWLFFVLLALISAEWFMRKYFGGY
jgi:hypothetical protein